jgi:hypothetical protein
MTPQTILPSAATELLEVVRRAVGLVDLVDDSLADDRDVSRAIDALNDLMQRAGNRATVTKIERGEY